MNPNESNRLRQTEKFISLGQKIIFDRLIGYYQSEELLRKNRIAKSGDTSMYLNYNYKDYILELNVVDKPGDKYYGQVIVKIPIEGAEHLANKDIFHSHWKVKTNDIYYDMSECIFFDRIRTHSEEKFEEQLMKFITIGDYNF